VTTTPSFLGQVNNAGSERALYLKLFTGEVYEAFRNATIFKDKVMNRTLRNGKEAQFIHTGRMTAEYHVPGTAILGSGNPPVAETTITMDDLLISHAFVYRLDEILAQYEVRGPISRQIGQALAEHYDRRVARVCLGLPAKPLLFTRVSPVASRFSWVLATSTMLRPLWTASLKLLPAWTRSLPPRMAAVLCCPPSVLQPDFPGRYQHPEPRLWQQPGLAEQW
jgi:hypothetical protein